MHWIFASLLGNACIMAVEYLNHAGAYGSWPRTLLRTAPFIIVAQWGLYHAFSHSKHWLTAWAVFTIGNAVMRVASVGLFAGNEIGSWTQVIGGVSVMIGGSLLIKGGLR